MKIKSVMLMIMAVVVGRMGFGVPALATEVTMAAERDLMSTQANEVLSDLFLIESILPTSNVVHYTFNAQQRRNIGMWALYLATYDYENVPMSVADAGLEELGVVEKPSWAKSVFVDAPNFTSDLRSASMNGYYVPDMKVRYNPGILYYALQVYDSSKGADAAELYWVRGKIDYRECAHTSLYGEPYMRMSCTGKISGNKYSYDRWRESGDVYKTWSDEWNEELNGDLGEVKSEIETWDGDEVLRNNIADELDRIELVAEDASGVVGIRDEVERLREKLKVKNQEFIDQKEEEERKKLEEEEKKRLEEEERKRLEEEERKRLEEEQKRLEEEAKQKLDEANKRPVVSWKPSVSTGVESEEKKETFETVFENSENENESWSAAAVSTISSNSDENGEGELSLVEPEGAQNGAEGVTEPAHVPALREGEIEAMEELNIWKWLWWVIILVLGLVAGVSWWVKRAFFDKREL